MLRTTALVAVLGLLAATAQAQPACQTCPSDAQTSAIGSGIGIFRYNTTTGTLVPYTSGTLSECTTLLIQANVSYVPIVTDPGGNEFVGAGFTAGTGWLVIDEGDNGSAEFACNITPANMATTIVGGTGPNACPGSVSVKNMRTFIYNPSPGVTTVRIRFNYTNGIVLLGDCSDRVSATPDRSVSFSPCLDDSDPCTTDTCETATLTPALAHTKLPDAVSPTWSVTASTANVSSTSSVAARRPAIHPTCRRRRSSSASLISTLRNVGPHGRPETASASAAGVSGRSRT